MHVSHACGTIIADWVNKLNPAGEFMKILRQKIEEWIEDFINMFVSTSMT